MCQDQIVEDRSGRAEISWRAVTGCVCVKKKRKMGGFYVMLMSAEWEGLADRRYKLGLLGLATDK